MTNADITDDRLMSFAVGAMENAYAPYSRFHVGAALVTPANMVYTGCNVENASYGLTVCAERVAVFNAVSAGQTKIARMAIVSSSGGQTFPCGACRQVLNEFGQNMAIIVRDTNGVMRHYKLSGLLPHSFGADDLT